MTHFDRCRLVDIPRLIVVNQSLQTKQSFVCFVSREAAELQPPIHREKEDSQFFNFPLAFQPAAWSFDFPNRAPDAGGAPAAVILLAA